MTNVFYRCDLCCRIFEGFEGYLTHKRLVHGMSPSDWRSIAEKAVDDAWERRKE